MSEPSSCQLRHVAVAAAKVLENADSLCKEASILAGAGCLSRALFLHQISMEECAKVDMLGAYAMSLLMGHDVNSGKFFRALADHKSKNFSNAYLIPATETEKQARLNRDWRSALKEFKIAQAKFHAKSNANKNAALYVDVALGKCTAPSEIVTETMVGNLRERNFEFIGYARDMVRVLRRWETCADEISGIATWFESRAEELMANGGKDRLDEVMSTLLQEARERMMAGRSKA